MVSNSSSLFVWIPILIWLYNLEMKSHVILSKGIKIIIILKYNNSIKVGLSRRSTRSHNISFYQNPISYLVSSFIRKEEWKDVFLDLCLFRALFFQHHIHEQWSWLSLIVHNNVKPNLFELQHNLFTYQMNCLNS